jgi:hypothetical protein
VELNGTGEWMNMDQHKITADEKKTAKENAVSVVKKLLTGILLILFVGFVFFAVLFILMLLI